MKIICIIHFLSQILKEFATNFKNKNFFLIAKTLLWDSVSNLIKLKSTSVNILRKFLHELRQNFEFIHFEEIVVTRKILKKLGANLEKF